MFLHCRQIRYVHIPDSVDVSKTLEKVVCTRCHPHDPSRFLTSRLVLVHRAQRARRNASGKPLMRTSSSRNG